MDSRKTNWLFLVIILTHFAVVGVLLWLGNRINFNMAVNCIVSEMIILLPGAMFLLGTKGRANDKLGFHKVKVTSLLMVVLFTFLCMPLVTVLNLFSMFFSSNAVASMEGDILEVGFPGMLALIGIYGPFCEDFVFREHLLGDPALLGAVRADAPECQSGDLCVRHRDPACPSGGGDRKPLDIGLLPCGV